MVGMGGEVVAEGHRLLVVKLPRELKPLTLKFAGEWRERCWRYLYGDEGVADQYLWYYVPEAARELKSNVRQYRRQIGRGLRPKWHRYTRKTRTRPRYRLWPTLLVGFYEAGKRAHGSTRAPVRVYLDKGVLRLTLPVGFDEAAYLAEQGWEPSARVLVKGRHRVVKGGKYAVVEVVLQPSTLVELHRLIDMRCEFTAQLVCKRRPAVKIIARREVRVELKLPLLALFCDLNSAYGLVVRGLEITEAGVRLVVQRRYRPPSHAVRERIAAELQSLGRYGEANAVRRRERSLNVAWEKSVVADLRKIIRGYIERGYTVVLLVDLPFADGLKGSRLQRTLLRVAERLGNVACFEGALFREWRSSGKRCPICGGRGEEYEKRKYACKRCGVRWLRDPMSCINGIVSWLERGAKRPDWRERALEWLRVKAEKNNGDLTKL